MCLIWSQTLKTGFFSRDEAHLLWQIRERIIETHTPINKWLTYPVPVASTTAPCPSKIDKCRKPRHCKKNMNRSPGRATIKDHSPTQIPKGRVVKRETTKCGHPCRQTAQIHSTYAPPIPLDIIMCYFRSVSRDDWRWFACLQMEQRHTADIYSMVIKLRIDLRLLLHKKLCRTLLAAMF